ncbi:protein rogdi homolog isoform X2 [Dysidea avara]
MKKELAWLMETEIPRLAAIFDDLMKKCSIKLAPLAMPSSLQTSTASTRPLLLNSQQLGDAIKGHVTISGDKISKAEVTLKLPGRNNHRVVKTQIKEHEAWKLQQIQNACNHFTIAQTKCPSMSKKLAKLRSPKSVLQAVGEVSAIIQQSMDSLVLPVHPKIAEIFSTNRQRPLKPELPDDILLDFYISSDHLLLTVYILGQAHLPRVSHANLPSMAQLKEQQQQQPKTADKTSVGECVIGTTFEHSSHTYEVTNQLQVQTPVPWLSEVLAVMEEIVEVCQEISDKIRGFDIQELTN